MNYGSVYGDIPLIQSTLHVHDLKFKEQFFNKKRKNVSQDFGVVFFQPNIMRDCNVGCTLQRVPLLKVAQDQKANISNFIRTAVLTVHYSFQT